MDSLSRRRQAIQLQDCECIGVKVCEIVNGTSISLELEQIFSSAGIPDAIRKDCDYTPPEPGPRGKDQATRTEIHASGLNLAVVLSKHIMHKQALIQIQYL